MKHTLFTLLAALVASPAFAGNLNTDDWTRHCDLKDGHAHNFTFDENGNLVFLERPSDLCQLYYTSTAHKMENGSSLAITLQVASIQGLGDFTVCSSSNLDADDAAFLYVQTDGETDRVFELIHWDNVTASYIHHTLAEASDTSASLTLNFIVENGNLCYTYSFNGGESEKFTVAEEIDTSLAWQPHFVWDTSNATEVTVTEVTFSTSSPMVPEPTTATLSLLALAGLAARRRRK